MNEVEMGKKVLEVIANYNVFLSEVEKAKVASTNLMVELQSLQSKGLVDRDTKAMLYVKIGGVLSEIDSIKTKISNHSSAVFKIAESGQVV